MIFLTVGTEFPFDRLVRAVDRMVSESVLNEEVIAQIGFGRYRPDHMPYFPSMEKAVFDEHMRGSSAIIGHAGAGTILQALELRKPLLVMPRLKKYGEHVNNHQVGTARKFESLGYILTAYDTGELSTLVKNLHTFRPPVLERQKTKELANNIKEFLDGIAAS
jgi:UDP-N-acetylglucosamine transferase subunit ALG13